MELSDLSLSIKKRFGPAKTGKVCDVNITKVTTPGIIKLAFTKDGLVTKVTFSFNMLDRFNEPAPKAVRRQSGNRRALLKACRYRSVEW